MRPVLFAALVAAAGCTAGSGNTCTTDCSSYATYQACWDDHHVDQGFDVQKAVEVCCIDHGIGDAPMNTVCGDTAAACEAYVTANLSGSDVTAADISAACTDYIDVRG